MRTTDKIIWLAIGAAFGAGAALLYAPQSGRDTRKYIRRKAEDARDSLADTTGQFRDTLVEKGESVLDAGRGAYRKGVKVAAGAAEAASDLFDRTRQQVRG